MATFRYVRLTLPNTNPPQYTYVYFQGQSEGDINDQLRALSAETEVEFGGGGYSLDKSYTSGKTQEEAYANLQKEATTEFFDRPQHPAAQAFGADYQIVQQEDELAGQGIQVPRPFFPAFSEGGNKIGEAFPTILGRPSASELEKSKERQQDVIDTKDIGGWTGERFRPAGMAEEDVDRDIAAGFQRFMAGMFPDTQGIAPTQAVRQAADAAFGGLRDLWNIQSSVTRNPIFQYAGQSVPGDPSFGNFLDQFQQGALSPGLGLAQGLGNLSSLLGGGMGITPEMASRSLIQPYIAPETIQGATQVGNMLESLIQQLNMPSAIARSVASRVNPFQLMGQYQQLGNNPQQNFLDFAAKQLGLAGFLRPTVQAGQTLQPFGGNIGIGE